MASKKRIETNNLMFSARKQSVEFDDLLPFSLQDLCLLQVINDLDSYPVLLLASMPRWFRTKLLKCMPALDLCYYDHTPVAREINVNDIWSAKFRDFSQNWVYKPFYNHSRERQLSFHLSCASQANVYSIKSNIGSALNDIHFGTSTREDYLLRVTTALLMGQKRLNIKTALISIDSKQLLRDLLQYCGPNLPSDQIHSVVAKQKTGLKLVEETFVFERVRGRRMVNVTETHAMLVPQRFVPHSECRDHTSRVLSLVANNCSLRPYTANLYLEAMAKEMLASLQTERYAHENGLKISPQRIECALSVHQILSKVRALRLSSHLYENIGIIIRIIEAASEMEQDSELKYLFCDLSDLYIDIVKPLSNLFHLPSFYKLTLELSNGVCQVNLVKLIHSFLQAPCSSTQALDICIHPEHKDYSFSYTVKEEDIAMLDLGEHSIPDCAIEHKMVYTSERTTRQAKSYATEILHILLQFSKVRLNEILIDGFKDLHLCALHPDLQVMKIKMELHDSVTSTSTEDLIALLKMPFLQEISIRSSREKVKVDLEQGLYERAQAQLPPLNKSLFIRSGRVLFLNPNM